MDVRIGVIHTVKEIDVELPDDADRDAAQGEHRRRRSPTTTTCSGSPTATAARSRCPSAKIAYVEIGSPDDERRIGFGAS